MLQAETFNLSLDASSGTSGFTAQTAGGYSLTGSGLGGSPPYYHLGHVRNNPQDEILELDTELLLGPAAELRFDSMLLFGLAGAEFARVQVSADGGTTWNTVYDQNGGEELSFSTRTVDLSAFANQVVKLRFNYAYAQGNAFYPVDNQTGWFFDNIVVSGANQIAQSTEYDIGTATSFDFTPLGEGTFLLQVTPLLYGGYPLGYGEALTVTASDDVQPETEINIASWSFASGSVVRLVYEIANPPSAFSVVLQQQGANETWSALPAGPIQDLGDGRYTQDFDLPERNISLLRLQINDNASR